MQGGGGSGIGRQYGSEHLSGDWGSGLRKDSVRVGDTTHGRSLWKVHSLGSTSVQGEAEPWGEQHVSGGCLHAIDW